MISMSNLNDKLIDIYMTFKNHKNSPVPLDTIKEYLELQGVSFDDYNADDCKNKSKICKGGDKNGFSIGNKKSSSR